MDAHPSQIWYSHTQVEECSCIPSFLKGLRTIVPWSMVNVCSLCHFFGEFNTNSGLSSISMFMTIDYYCWIMLNLLIIVCVAIVADIIIWIPIVITITIINVITIITIVMLPKITSRHSWSFPKTPGAPSTGVNAKTWIVVHIAIWKAQHVKFLHIQTMHSQSHKASIIWLADVDHHVCQVLYNNASIKVTAIQNTTK